MNATRPIVALIAASVLTLSGCLGTQVNTPLPRGNQSHMTTNVHILAAPFRIEARACQNGMTRAISFVPLWGVAVGILTLGIIVPKTTTYWCAR